MQGSLGARALSPSGHKSPFSVLPVAGFPLLVLVAVALAFGGGGSAYPLANLFVQLFALGSLALFAFSHLRFRESMPGVLKALVACTLILPILQLIPLPSAVWQALPGRELALESLELVDAAGGWFPLSVDYLRTAVALASLLPVLAVFLLFPWGRSGSAHAILIAIVALGCSNLIFGALQIAIPGNLINPYPVLSDGRLYGFFANHNSAGLFFVICLCAAIGAFQLSPQGSMARNVFAACGILFIVGAILTNSRSSTALLLLPISLAGWIAFQAQEGRDGRRRFAIISIAGVAFAAIGGAILLSGSRLEATWRRFSSFEDHRPEIWEDSLVSAERFMPFGSGFGTFRDVFAVDESLEYVLAGHPGRAHNEYLEVAIESGVFGLTLILLWVAWLTLRVYEARAERYWPAVRAAGLAGLCIFLQAFVDYPLRNQAMLCIAGLLIAAMVGTEPSDKGS